ncbi:MAG: DegT/DnrJ/EryC1/StrS family aminotransferase, partial [Nanoarchaeota archaeon]
MKIEFYRHNIEETDIKKAVEVLHSIFLTTGPVTAEFESKFAGYTGLREVIGVNSCTAALHLSLLALGIGNGDEVIT